MITEVTLRVPQEVVPELKRLAEKMAGLVENGQEEDFLTVDLYDQCVAEAINQLKAEGVIRSSGDYAWIMQVMNEQYLEDFEDNYTPQSFIGYLESIDIEGRPGKSALYDNCMLITGTFPSWEFTDNPSHKKAAKRINVAKRFISVFKKFKQSMSEGFSE